MTSKTELRQLSSEALFSRLLSSDSEDWVIKDILRTRMTAGMRVSFNDGGVRFGPDEPIKRPTDVAAGATDLARICQQIIDSGWQGEGLKYDPETAMAWLHLAVKDNTDYADLIPEAQRFHNAAQSKWKLWMTMKELAERKHRS